MQEIQGDIQAHFSTSQQIPVMGNAGSSASMSANSAKPPERPARKEKAGQSPKEETSSKGGHRGASLPPKGECSPHPVLPPQCSLLTLPGAADGWVRTLHSLPYTQQFQLHTEVPGSALDEQGLAEGGHSLPHPGQ